MKLNIFSKNIPEIKSISEDNDGNIEIVHSKGKFKLNNKNIIDIQVSQKQLPISDKFSNFLEKDMDTVNVILMILGISLFSGGFGLWNMIVYKKFSNVNEILFQDNLHLISNFLFPFSPFENWVDYILNIGLFLLLSAISIGLVILVVLIILSLTRHHNLLTVKTESNEFNFQFDNDKSLDSSKTISEVIKSNSIKIENNWIADVVFLLILTAPFIAFFLNNNEPFWFSLNTNYRGYFIGEPKGYLELFIDGMASFGGIVIILSIIALVIIAAVLGLVLVIISGVLFFLSLPSFIFTLLFKIMSKRFKNYFLSAKSQKMISEVAFSDATKVSQDKAIIRFKIDYFFDFLGNSILYSIYPFSLISYSLRTKAERRIEKWFLYFLVFWLVVSTLIVVLFLLLFLGVESIDVQLVFIFWIACLIYYFLFFLFFSLYLRIKKV
jgi:hypothetical protein